MYFSTGWAASAALLFAMTAAHAQGAPNDVRPPSTAVSDFDGPYAAMPPDVLAPRYGYGPSLLPATEVYTVLRENGFSPLGIPRLRGNIYTIAAIDRRGDDGRLVIDARNGRIVRFVPAYGMGPAFDETAPYGPQGALPPPTVVRGVPRPPAPIPHVVSRGVPVPKPSPLAAKPAPATAAAPAPAPAAAPVPAPAQQAAVVPPKPAETQAVPQTAAPTVGQTPVAPAPAAPAASAILPTQEMPKVQGLE